MAKKDHPCSAQVFQATSDHFVHTNRSRLNPIRLKMDLFKENNIYDQYIYKERGIIIKQTVVRVLDEKDLEFSDALQSLNVPRNVAAMITCLANVSEATSREIETGTNLRQPEVSIGMRTLRQNNWIDEREVKSEGKGRPMKVYKLRVTIDDIIKHYETEKNRESDRTNEAIQRLKELSFA